MMTREEARDITPDGAAIVEAAIDAAIRDAAKAGRWPATTLASWAPRAVVEAVLVGYRRLGWSIQIVDDPRDGDYIKIEAP